MVEVLIDEMIQFFLLGCLGKGIYAIAYIFIYLSLNALFILELVVFFIKGLQFVEAFSKERFYLISIRFLFGKPLGIHCFCFVLQRGNGIGILKKGSLHIGHVFHIGLNDVLPFLLLFYCVCYSTTNQ